MRAVVSGGRELDRAPRFLLAQDLTHRIVGVACRAADLNPAMSSDGDRALYCFVGWTAPRDGQREPAVPPFEELCRNHVAWAGPVYTEVLAKVWTISATAYSPPERTDPGEAPWPPADRDVAAVPRPAEGLWPEQAWPALWAAAQAASSPLTCVIGWRNERSARSAGATHLGAADAPARPLPVPPQLVQPQPPPPVHVPAPRKLPVAEPLPGAPPDPARRAEPVRVPARAVSRTWWRLPVPAALGVAAVVGAAVGAVITALASGGSSAAPPAPPVTIQLVVPSGAGPAPGTVLSYQNQALSAGPATARLATWSGKSDPSAADCAGTLRAPPSAAPITAAGGERICVQLTGQPARYGFILVQTAGHASVTALATIWP